MKISWTKWGESILCFVSVLQGLDLIWFSQTTSLMTGYALLIVYRTLYQILITVARYFNFLCSANEYLVKDFLSLMFISTFNLQCRSRSWNCRRQLRSHFRNQYIRCCLYPNSVDVAHKWRRWSGAWYSAPVSSLRMLLWRAWDSLSAGDYFHILQNKRCW